MFLFKKIFPLFFFPVPLVAELLLLGLALLWFSRRQKAGKVLVSLATVLLLLCSFIPVPNLVLRPLEQYYPPVTDLAAGSSEPGQAVKYIVVLGGGVTADPRLPVTTWLSPASLARVVEAVRLYHAAPGRQLIFSGGAVFSSVPEAQAMARVALLMGVNPHDILQEAASTDTEAQARLIKPLVGREKFFLVTSASHLPRSMALFHHQGLAPLPAPAGYLLRQSAQRSPEEYFPGSFGLQRLELALHEYLGLAWARLRGVI